MSISHGVSGVSVIVCLHARPQLVTAVLEAGAAWCLVPAPGAVRCKCHEAVFL